MFNSSGGDYDCSFITGWIWGFNDADPPFWVEYISKEQLKSLLNFIRPKIDLYFFCTVLLANPRSSQFLDVFQGIWNNDWDGTR